MLVVIYMKCSGEGSTVQQGQLGRSTQTVLVLDESSLVG